MQQSSIRLFAVSLSTLVLSSCAPHSVALPLPNTLERATPLYYGKHVSSDPADNPITPPERFEGYHVGTDFEVSAEELDKEVPVSAICTGTVTFSSFAEGYGGVILEQCLIQNVTATVIYGHLAVDSLPLKGARIAAGQQIAVLGSAKSHDTDGNRKHLHLGIRIGTGNEMLGYVQTPKELSKYINAQVLLPPLFGTGGSVEMKPYWKTN